jgi:hypothetical protein
MPLFFNGFPGKVKVFEGFCSAMRFEIARLINGRRQLNPAFSEPPSMTIWPCSDSRMKHASA